MNFDELLKNKKIEVVQKEENPDFSRCDSDIKFAKKSLNENADWSAIVSYNAVLRAGNKFMNLLGYRVIGKEHHKNLFEFLTEYDFDAHLIRYFDRVRRKRNDFVYRDKIEFSLDEAKEILIKSEEFVHKIRTLVHKIRTGAKSEK